VNISEYAVGNWFLKKKYHNYFSEVLGELGSEFKLSPPSSLLWKPFLEALEKKSLWGSLFCAGHYGNLNP
jgi:hypothetical protein